MLGQERSYINQYLGEIIVIKYGGHAMASAAMLDNFAVNIAQLKQYGINPLIIHGGGPQINAMCRKMGKEPHFIEGIRISDQEMVNIAEMVLCGKVNKDIVLKLNDKGARAIGLCGKDGKLVSARKAGPKIIHSNDKALAIDLGYVGEVEAVDCQLLHDFIALGLIPVIAPIAADHQSIVYNINADMFAAAIAASLKAKRLLFLTDVAGILDKEGNLLAQLTIKQARALLADGTVSGGMIPKLEMALWALERGVEAVAILNAQKLYQILLELFTCEGAGTLIKPV